MICISINQESRRLAQVDLLNAGPQCDLVEIRLDRFGKAPEVGELLAHKPKPVIMSCRRVRDGGAWEGSEDDRQAILRQCIVSKADYVEIELDIADQIRRFPPSQRVVSYTNLQETPDDILDIYAQAQSKSPDVIKLTTLARTPEEAWPLVQVMAKQTIPTVVVGLGKPGIMLSILGKKIGAPWTYAALERGMEAYPGQATIADLRAVYHYDQIGKGTRFIGVTGFGPREYAAVAALNAAFAHAQLPARCLPMGVGNVKLFRKVMDAVKLAGVVVDEAHQHQLVGIAGELHSSAEQTRTADLLLSKDEQWKAYNMACLALVAGLARALSQKFAGAVPLKDRMVMLVGLTPLGRALAGEIQRQGGNITICSHQKKAGLQMAQDLGCRFIQFEALYSSSHDVLVVCDEEKDQAPGRGAAGVHPGYLKAGMTVLDLTADMDLTPLLQGAKDRGCLIVDPHQMLIDRLEMQARKITGKEGLRESIVKAARESLRLGE